MIIKIEDENVLSDFKFDNHFFMQNYFCKIKRTNLTHTSFEEGL